MFEIADVSMRFGEKVILDRFSLSLAPNQAICVLGPSGCGKTTLLRIASGLLRPDKGMARLPEGRCSYVFQEDRLLPWCGALENLTVAGVREPEAKYYLDRVGLGKELHTRPGNLSGGMCRRLAIARAMAFGGEIFFLDEPLRGLDAATADPILTLMRETICEKTSFIITHREDEALLLSDTLVALEGPPLRVTGIASTGRFADVQELREWMDSVSREWPNGP